MSYEISETFTLVDAASPRDPHTATAYDVADWINSWAPARGEKVEATVNGVPVSWGFASAAKGWGTGSLSVRTPARTTRGTTDAWWKIGATVTVVVTG